MRPTNKAALLIFKDRLATEGTESAEILVVVDRVAQFVYVGKGLKKNLVFSVLSVAKPSLTKPARERRRCKRRVLA